MTSASRDLAPTRSFVAHRVIAHRWLGLVAIASILVAAPVLAAGAPESDDDKAFYTIGANQARQLGSLGELSDRDLEMFVQGLRDALAGRELAVDPQQGNGLVRTMVEARQKAASEAEKTAGASFAATYAKKKGAVTTESGLVYVETKAGSGASPAATDKVRVHYHGTLRDGTVFDSSVDRGQPAEFPLNRVIACWTEGVAKMKVGGKSTLVCPPSIAYGDRGTGRIPPGATLAFEVELLEIVK